jgi:hypothetical protein
MQRCGARSGTAMQRVPTTRRVRSTTALTAIADAGTPETPSNPGSEGRLAASRRSGRQISIRSCPSARRFSRFEAVVQRGSWSRVLRGNFVRHAGFLGWPDPSPPTGGCGGGGAYSTLRGMGDPATCQKTSHCLLTEPGISKVRTVRRMSRPRFPVRFQPRRVRGALARGLPRRGRVAPAGAPV